MMAEGSVSSPLVDKWAVVYPVYINARKTAADGRRVAKARAVDNPTAQEIYDVCAHLGLRCELESDKAYPRDFLQRGRVRVLLRDPATGLPSRPDIATTKRALLLKLGELIPKLQSRQGGTAAQSVGTAAIGKGKGGKRRGR